MLYYTICLPVRDGVNFDEALAAFKEVEALTNQEEGCVYFHAYPADREKRQIILWEIWKDRDAVEKNHQSAYTKALFAKGYTGPPVFANESEV